MLIGRSGANESVSVRLTVSNTHLGCLNWIAGATGIGRIQQTREASATHKAGFFWLAHNDGADSVLRQVRPYLRIKSAQADLAMHVIQRLRTPKDKATFAWQTEFKARMRALNRRGGTT